MPAKSVLLSVRLSPQEAEFIDQLVINDASTPSQKLRAIIESARKRKLGTEDFASALRLAHESVGPSVTIIKESENEQKIHSEVVSRVSDWTMECFAYLSACNGPKLGLGKKELLKVENNLLNRVSVLMQSILQMAVTENGPVYDTTNLQAAVKPVVELAKIIDSQRGK